MAWLKINKAPLEKSIKRDTPDGLWFRCNSCAEVTYRSDFEANQRVCLKCDAHTPLPALDRLQFFLDPENIFLNRLKPPIRFKLHF
jgi:acetyl-CoA carboxylase carboxyl transferase subunit beta